MVPLELHLGLGMGYPPDGTRSHSSSPKLAPTEPPRALAYRLSQWQYALTYLAPLCLLILSIMGYGLERTTWSKLQMTRSLVCLGWNCARGTRGGCALNCNWRMGTGRTVTSAGCSLGRLFPFG